MQEAQKETLLFEWLYLKNFKTSQIKQLTEVLITDKQIIGKQFSSSTHQLVVDRKYIIVQIIEKEPSEKVFVIKSISFIVLVLFRFGLRLRLVFPDRDGIIQ